MFETVDDGSGGQFYRKLRSSDIPADAEGTVVLRRWLFTADKEDLADDNDAAVDLLEYIADLEDC